MTDFRPRRSALYMPGANDAGQTRPERLQTLRRSFADNGIAVQLDLVDNVPHDGIACVGQVQDFLAGVLHKVRTPRTH